MANRYGFSAVMATWVRYVASTQDGWKYVYRDTCIWFFFGGGGIIKEDLILVISIVTLQNYYGDLGEVCGKYPGWLTVPWPFDICHFFTQLTILFTYIETYGFWGARYKRRSNFSYIDCYTPTLLWRPRWDMWQVPRMGESTGTFWYLQLFDPVHYSTYVYRDFLGPVIKEDLILVISIVALQNYYGNLGEVCGKYPGWLKVPWPFDICHFFTQLTNLLTYIEIYGFWRARYKRRSSFSYVDCYTPKLLWRPRWGMW